MRRNLAASIALAGSLGLSLAGCSPQEPLIVDSSALPDTTDTQGPYLVTARVEGRLGVDGVVLVWQNLTESTVTAQRVTMTQDSAGAWSGGIPGQGIGALIAFHVEATNQSGDVSSDPLAGSTSECGDQYCFHVVAY